MNWNITVNYTNINGTLLMIAGLILKNNVVVGIGAGMVMGRRTKYFNN